MRSLKLDGISVFLQDKSSRFVIAKQDIIASKVDLDLNDTRYQRIEEDDCDVILNQIADWYSHYKDSLSVVETDISNWLINCEAKPGKLKVLLKTHKPGVPVREVFSVCSQPVENLSALIQHCYLGPIVNSGKLKWRLKDTNHLVQFLHTVNDYIKDNRICTSLSMCCVDIKNMFPSIYKDLAFPAIRKKLNDRGHSSHEIEAVLEALRIVRDGTRVQWKGDVVKQLDGCSLGPADSCDYSDIALDAFLEVVVPKLETMLNLDLRFLRFFRDDGFLIFFGNGNLIIDMLDILNSERAELTFTTEYCPCGNILGCCQSCPQVLPYLDCSISTYMYKMDDGLLVPQLKTTTYSKPTDVHHYIDPTSCTPNLSKKSPAIIKGVAHRLRVTNMLDEDLLKSFNTFSGYLVSSGYDKVTVLKYFNEMLSISNRSLVFKEKVLDSSFKIALVTGMHPALPNVSRLFDRYYPIIKSCPVSAKVFPRECFIAANRKLPNLSALLAANPFNVVPQSSTPKGFYKSMGCKCYICKEGQFTSIVYSPAIANRGFSIPQPICCRSKNVVYQIICVCGKNYVGRTAKPKPRWSNHKSHVRCQQRTCNLATHCIDDHSEIARPDKLLSTNDVKAQFSFTLLEAIGEGGTDDQLKKLEDVWRDRLQSWAPLGLNTKED